MYKVNRSTYACYIVFSLLKGCKNSFLVGQHVKKIVHCSECNKLRCIYSKKALTSREDRGFRRLLENYDYTCGSINTPDGNFFLSFVNFLCFEPLTILIYDIVCLKYLLFAGDPLQDTVFVKLQLSCASHV